MKKKFLTPIERTLLEDYCRKHSIDVAEIDSEIGYWENKEHLEDLTNDKDETKEAENQYANSPEGFIDELQDQNEKLSRQVQQLKEAKIKTKVIEKEHIVYKEPKKDLKTEQKLEAIKQAIIRIAEEVKDLKAKKEIMEEGEKLVEVGEYFLKYADKKDAEGRIRELEKIVYEYLITAHGVPFFKCERCWENFKELNEMKEVGVLHSFKKSDLVGFRCDVCGFKFVTNIKRKSCELCQIDDKDGKKDRR